MFGSDTQTTWTTPCEPADSNARFKTRFDPLWRSMAATMTFGESLMAFFLLCLPAWGNKRIVSEAPPPDNTRARVAVIMGSRSDLDFMSPAVEILKELGVPHEVQIVSAHRTPAWMIEFATGAEARGLEVIIAGAGGAAHLPGMVAANTLVPVLGVPVPATSLLGVDSLLSIVQMPKGVPV